MPTCDQKWSVVVSSDPRPLVVVGVDGSPQSLSAARWAAEEAALRHHGVHVLYAAHLPAVGYPALGYPADFVELTENQGQSLLAGVVHDIALAHPQLAVTTAMTRSDPRSALVDTSRGASLTVVGSLGGGRIREVMLGSVAMHVAAHGRSPVAVIPFDRDQRGGPILVGVDGSTHSAAAVGYAFDEAAVRGTGVVAVLAVDNWAWQGFARHPIRYDEADSQEQHAVISEQLAGWADKYPDVPVRQEVFRGPAADCLVGYARHALPIQQPQLIVVGSRGRGALTGLFAGSTSHALITHAGCPVVVVRSFAE
jgi:nucleotide-binding universal stress UspA family protein